jgi:HK97 family phage major capsid protein
MGPTMDDSLLQGSGTPPQLNGILASATAAASGADFRAAVITAVGEPGNAGAMTSSIVAFANRVIVAAERARVSAQGVPIHNDAPLTIGKGIQVVSVPKLAGGATPEILVADVSSVYLFLRDQFVIEMNPAFGFDRDGTGLRVKSRVNVAAPTPAKSLRKAVIGSSSAVGEPGRR